MTTVECYSRRLLSPFHGTLQVLALAHGEAESKDGINWVLYVSHDSIVSHTGMSEVRYGSWSSETGLQLSMVRGTGANAVIETVGEKLVSALEQHAHAVPFEPRDHYECWLLAADGKPLALIDSAVDADEIQVHDTPLWHPGAAAYEQFQSNNGDAARLRYIVNSRAGDRPVSIWVHRVNAGDARSEDGSLIEAAAFPGYLISSQWSNPEDEALVTDYLHWQAPWLLQLHGLSRARRVEFEQQAWKRPLLCAKQYRLFVDLQDEKGLRVARVQARLMGDDDRGQALQETFIHTGDKESYSP